MTLQRLIEMAQMRIGAGPKKGKPDLGYNWVCYCTVCCKLRKMA